jgi:hypothetical protein
MSKILTVFTALPVPVKRRLGVVGWTIVSLLVAAMGFAGYALLYSPK